MSDITSKVRRYETSVYSVRDAYTLKILQQTIKGLYRTRMKVASVAARMQEPYRSRLEAEADGLLTLSRNLRRLRDTLFGGDK